jgi:hypothetical protein
VDDRNRTHPYPDRRPGSSELPLDAVDIALRLAIVALALGTAYIHSTLGGLQFTLNAIGYVFWTGAMVVPLAFVTRYRWLVRIGLVGYAATTIVAWAIDGPYYSTAYIAKAIELALITLLVIDIARRDGNPIDRMRAELQSQFGRRRGRAAGRRSS